MSGTYPEGPNTGIGLHGTLEQRQRAAVRSFCVRQTARTTLGVCVLFHTLPDALIPGRDCQWARLEWVHDHHSRDRLREPCAAR
jgi:hypothetical protein